MNWRAGATIAEKLAHYSMPEPNSGCWLWTGCVTERGYACLKIDGTYIYAHRLAFEEMHGKIPESVLVCHQCDVPSCVNPQHLHPGDHLSNQAEKAQRGRVKGERNPCAKLTAAQVKEIRSSVGASNRALSEKFGVANSTISMVRNGLLWRHTANG
jgi:hypothetical protein